MSKAKEKGREMVKEKVILERLGEIGIIHFNEGAKMNALTAELKEDLRSVLDGLEKESFKCIIFTGRGQSFCAGGDIEAMQQPYDADLVRSGMQLSSDIIEKIRNLNAITISAVNGFAAGAGFSIALACDYVLVTPTTKFVLAFKNVGLVPDLGLHSHLLQIAPMQQVKQWIFEGKVFTAEEAHAAKFANRIVDGDVLEAAIAYAKQLNQGPIDAYLQSKKILHHIVDEQFVKTMGQENLAQVHLRAGEEHIQCLTQFLNKKIVKS